MKWWVWCAGLIALVSLSGCQGMIKADPTIRAFYDAVHNGDMGTIRRLGAPELFTADAEAEIANLRRILPREAPKSVKGQSRNISKMLNAGETLQVVDLYEFSDRKALVSAVLHRTRSPEPWRVQGFNVRVLRSADLAANAFTFQHKGVGQFAFLAATIAMPVLMVMALVRVIRRKGLRRKWLWGILAFVGLCSFRMNWSDGSWETRPLTVQLVGAGVTSAAPGGVAPWILTFTLPVGAILILSGVWANPARAKPPKVKKADPQAFD